MAKSGPDLAVQHILPGWAMIPELYAPYECLARRSVVHDPCFFSESSRSVEETMSGSQEEDCFVTAHSLGCLFALKAAAGPGSRVRALVLFSPFAGFVSAPGYEAQDAESIDIMKRRLAENPGTLIRSFFRRTARPESMAFPVPFFFNGERLMEGLDILETWDMRRSLGKIEIPVLILQGKDDSICSEAMARYLEKNIPHAEFVLFEGAGHALPFTRTAECIGIIKRFLG